MLLDPETIKRIQLIYREDYSKEITADEAAEIGVRLIRLLRILTGPRQRPQSNRKGDLTADAPSLG